MSTAQVERFTHGAAVGVDVTAIERELAALWREAATGTTAVMRACSWNLVVFVESEAALARGRELAELVVEEVPARTLVIHHQRDAQGGRELDAFVSARCRLLPGGGKMLCTEEITLESRRTGMEFLPSLTRALLVPDIPTAVLCVGVPEESALLEELVSVADRVIFDSRGDALESVRHLGPRAIDLAWLRIAPWQHRAADAWDAGAWPVAPSDSSAETRWMRLWLDSHGVSSEVVAASGPASSSREGAGGAGGDASGAAAGARGGGSGTSSGETAGARGSGSGTSWGEAAGARGSGSGPSSGEPSSRAATGEGQWELEAAQRARETRLGLRDVVHLRTQELLGDSAVLRVALSGRALSPAWEAARALLERGGDGGVTASWNDFTTRFEKAATAAIAARGTFSCALTGGSAVKMYAQLARAPLDWSRIEFFFSDERLVPLESPDSNYRAAREALPQAKLHPVRVALSPTEAAQDYARQLPTTLDLVFLGMGPDGHVASLFPGHALLEERHARVAAVVDSPKPPSQRVTLTLRALHEAREVWFLVPGDSKKPVAHVARSDASSMLPAALVQRGARSTTWFLDP